MSSDAPERVEEEERAIEDVGEGEERRMCVRRERESVSRACRERVERVERE